MQQVSWVVQHAVPQVVVLDGHWHWQVVALNTCPSGQGPTHMPVLGHSTWHLYGKVVEPDPGPRPEYRPRERARRSAADFPAALFPSRGKDQP